LIGAFLFFPFPQNPPDVHEAQGGNSHPLSSARSWRPETWWNQSFPQFSIGTTGFQSFTLTRESHRISSNLTESHRIPRIPWNPKESDGINWGKATGVLTLLYLMKLVLVLRR
jgi:hypothetical protein